MSNRQLPLSFPIRFDATFKNFCVGNNHALVQTLENFLSAQAQEQCIYLWGASGVGCSHLLQACCHVIEAQAGSAMYLPLDMPGLTPAVLEDMEQLSLLCLDHIEAVLTDAQWEEALLHCYNRVRDQGMRLMVAGKTPPAQSACQLADLRSRLSWGLVLQVQPLSDEQKIKALQLRAHERGMQLSDEVGHFLLRHHHRDIKALFLLLDQLDRASLAEQRKLTIPFVKRVSSTAEESVQYD